MSEKRKYSGIHNREEKAGLSPYTIALRLRDLRTMFNFLASEKIITSNPVDNVKQPRFDREEKPSLRMNTLSGY